MDKTITSRASMDSWLGNRRKILVLNREDMISTANRNAWANYFLKQGMKVVFASGQLGMGTVKLGRLAKSLADGVNVKRRSKGLLPCPVQRLYTTVTGLMHIVTVVCPKACTPAVQWGCWSSIIPCINRLSERKFWLGCIRGAASYESTWHLIDLGLPFVVNL